MKLKFSEEPMNAIYEFIYSLYRYNGCCFLCRSALRLNGQNLIQFVDHCEPLKLFTDDFLNVFERGAAVPCYWDSLSFGKSHYSLDSTQQSVWLSYWQIRYSLMRSSLASVV